MKITYLTTCHIPYVVDYYRSMQIEIHSAEGLIESDWVIYGDPHEFIIGVEKPINQLIYEADRAGFNCIKCRKFEFYYTGEEEKKEDPRNRFFYYEENLQKSHEIIRKEHSETRLCTVNAFILNYNYCANQIRNETQLSDIRIFEPLRRHSDILEAP